MALESGYLFYALPRGMLTMLLRAPAWHDGVMKQGAYFYQ